MGSIVALWAIAGLSMNAPSDIPARFVIDPPACAPQWLDATRLEGMLTADTSTQTKAYIALIVPDCTVPGTIEFTILRPGRAPEGGHVQLNDVPLSFRLRTFALTVAERLVLAPLARPPRVPLRAEAPAKTKLPPRRDWSLIVRSKILAGLKRRETLAGLGLSIATRHRSLDFAFGVSGAAGDRPLSEGSAQLWMADLHLTGAWVGRGLGLTWSAGPQVGLGVAQINGQATGERAQGRGRATIVWLGGRVSTLWPLSDALAIEAQMHVRSFVRGIDGRHLGQVVAGLSGPYAGLDLGLRWTL